MIVQFEDALVSLKSGYKLRRRSWPEGNYLCIREGVLESCIEGCGSNPLHNVDVKELFAHDWEIA